MAEKKVDYSISETTITVAGDDARSTAMERPADASDSQQRSSNDGRKRKQHASASSIIKRLRLSTYWAIIEVLLITPLVVALTAHLGFSGSHFATSGLLLYIEVAWCSFLASRIAVQLLNWLWRCCVRFLNNEGLEAYKDFITHIRGSATIFLTAALCLGVSHTDILCFHNPSACFANWISKFQHALAATTIMSATFVVKAILVELLIVRAALRSMHKRQMRTNQVLESSAWLLDTLTPRDDTVKTELNLVRKFQLWRQWSKVWFRGQSTFSRLLLRPESTLSWRALEAAEDESTIKSTKDDADTATGDKVNRRDNQESKDGDEEIDTDEDFEDEDEKENFERTMDALLQVFSHIFMSKGFGHARTEEILDFDEDTTEKKDEGQSQPTNIDKIRRQYFEEVWDKAQESGGQWRFLRPEELTKLLDQDNDKNITKKECSDMLIEVAAAIVEVQEGIHGIRRAAADVDVVLSIALLCASALIYAAYFVHNFAAYATVLWSSFTGLAFALGATVTEFLASCFFVFCKQPYDVGDRVQIDDKDLIVVQIHLNYSIFRNTDDGTVLQICHSQLLEKWIANKTRMRTRCSIDVVKLTADCQCHDTDFVGKKLAELLADNKDCKEYLQRQGGMVLKDVSQSSDGSWKLDIRFKYREKLVYREQDLADCRESVREELEKMLRQSDKRRSCSKAHETVSKRCSV